VSTDRPPTTRTAPRRPADEQAREDLSYIRETLGRAATFTAVPGFGGIAMGAVGLAAAGVAARLDAPGDWLGTWLAAAAVAAALGAWATWHKARTSAVPLLSGAGRKFTLGLAPALLAGGALTLAIASLDADAVAFGEARARDAALTFRLLPGAWLLLYGAAVTAAGASSVRAVPLLGALLMVLGVGALLAPAAWGDAFLAAGFGGLQLAFGVYIARRHGG
jgi:hypothetical protein